MKILLYHFFAIFKVLGPVAFETQIFETMIRKNGS